MQDLNLFYLKCFLDAVLMGSISESACRNFISESAVSQGIKQLENKLKVSLCTHKKQQFKLTVKGQIVFLQAKEIFSVVRNLYDALDQHEQMPTLSLHFVTTNGIGLSLLPDFLNSFRLAHPNIELHFQFGGLNQIKGWLKQGISEFALILDSIHFNECQKLSLYKGKFCLFKHKAVKKPIECLGAYVEHRDGLMVPEFQSTYFQLHKKHLLIIGELNSWEFIARSIPTQPGY